jgi:transposase
LDERAQRRLLVLNHVLAGELTAAEASAYLRLSIRQVRRLLKRYRSAEGPAALVHGNRGRVPANRLRDDLRQQLVELASDKYQGINRAHLADLLAEREQLVVAERTLRRILAQAGLPAVRRRRPHSHRRRERMSQAGLLLQVDGSRHDWLQGRGPWLTLVGAIDDATGTITGAVFREQEDSAGYLSVLAQTAEGHGLPVGVYSDRHTIFWRGKATPSLAEQFSGRQPRTQVGRCLELAGIAWIGARSPQAKGRLERLWGTAQDRLLAELRLAGAANIEQANAVLADYLPRHNRRFAVAPANPEPAWRPLPAGRAAETVFCFRHWRKVAGDGTFSLAGRELMVSGRLTGAWKGRRLEIQERLDGSLWVELEGQHQPVVQAPPRPVVLRQPKPPKAPYIPPADHPWRRRYSPVPRCQSR